MRKHAASLKITKILVLIFIFAVFAEAALIYSYNPFTGVKCPNCESLNTKIWATDEPQLEYKCMNCGAYFFKDGPVFSYDKEINNIFTQNRTNKL